jgi:hypothetical protein
MVVIGVRDTKAILKVAEKLRSNQIPHYEWHEPDYAYGLTAIATAPLCGEQREVLSCYQVLKFAGGDGQPSCSVTANACSSASL